MRRFILTVIGSFLMCLGAVASDTWVVNSSGDTIWYDFHETYANVTYKGKYSNSYKNEYSKSIVIPEKVTYKDVTYNVVMIGSDAFSDCDKLTDIVIPNSVRLIQSDAFYKCFALKNISIPDSLSYIESRAFAGCTSLTDVALPDGVKMIGSSAFHSCTALKSITIPKNVTKIEKDVFKQCTSLVNVTISDSVKLIDRDAFSECSNLKNITIPKGVTEIKSDAFFKCIRLENIYVEKENPNYSSEDGVLFDKSKTKLILCPCGKKGFYRIPEGVQEVERGAFVCYGLMSITIPKSVKIMGAGFKKCDKLREVYNLSDLSMEIDADQANVYTSVPSVSHFKVLGDYVFYERNDSTIELLGYKGEAKSITLPSDYKGKKYTIAAMAFYASELVDVTIPGGVREVDEGAFSESRALKNVVMKNGVEKINLFAFSACSALKNVTIPSTLNDIRTGVFDECTSLTNVNVMKGNPDYSSENGVLFNGDKTELILYPSAKKGAYKIPNSVTRFESNAFENCVGLTSVTLSNNMKKINIAAFKNCTGLKSVVIPKNVTGIGYKAFLNCTSLTNVTIPDGVDFIDMAAFAGCCSLKSITIPSEVTKLDISVFAGCSGLKSITCKCVTPPEITWCTFENVDLDIPVYVPEKSVEKYKGAKYWNAFKNIKGKSFPSSNKRKKEEEAQKYIIMPCD